MDKKIFYAIGIVLEVAGIILQMRFGDSLQNLASAMRLEPPFSVGDGIGIAITHIACPNPTGNVPDGYVKASQGITLATFDNNPKNDFSATVRVQEDGRGLKEVDGEIVEKFCPGPYPLILGNLKIDIFLDGFSNIWIPDPLPAGIHK